MYGFGCCVYGKSEQSLDNVNKTSPLTSDMWVTVRSVVLLLYHFHNVGDGIAESYLVMVGVRLGVMGVVVMMGGVAARGAPTVIWGPVTVWGPARVKG